MSFMDLLNQELPSRKLSENNIDPDSTIIEESVDGDDIDDETYIESLIDEILEESDDESSNGIGDKVDIPDDSKKEDDEPPKDESKLEIKEGGDFDDFDFDEDEIADIIGNDEDDESIEDLSDEDLEELDQQLSGKMVDSVAGEEKPERLSPDEEMRADDMMSVAATAAIVNNEMNATERANFVESSRDVEIAINEGLLTESDIQDIADSDIVTESKYNNKMVIRLDKNAKMKQLYAIGVNVSAAAHKDPDYIKMKRLLRQVKIQRAKLRKKYHSEALKRMRVYMKRLASSKSKILSNIGKKISGKK